MTMQIQWLWHGRKIYILKYPEQFENGYIVWIKFFVVVKMIFCAAADDYLQFSSETCKHKTKI